MMKRLILIIINILFLINCSKESGAEKRNGTPPVQTTPPPGTLPNDLLPPISNSFLIKTTPENIFFGVSDFNIEKTKILTLTNNSTSEINNLLIYSSGDSSISINASNCINKKLLVGDSCQIIVKFLDQSGSERAYKKTIIASFGTITTAIICYGYSFDFNKIDNLIESIISKQIYETDTINNLYQGSWRSDDNVSNFINNIYIANSLLLSKYYYKGLLNIDGFNSLYSTNLNILDPDQSNWKVLDKALIYFYLNDNNNSIQSDDTYINFYKTNPLTNYNMSFQKWTISNSGITQPKDMSFPVIESINNIYKTIYSSNISDYALIKIDYLDSRKIISGSSSISDISAQLSYLLDYNNLSNTSYLENGLKEVELYFNYFKSINDSQSLSKMSNYYINHWEHSFNEMDISLKKYNSTSFDFSSFLIAGSNLTSLDTDKLSWIIDYSDWFVQTYSCRDIAYSLLNLTNSYNLGQLNESEKTRVSNLIKNGIFELKSHLACFYDENSKKFVSQENSPGSYNSNNGIPIILKIYSRVPDSIVSIDEKINLYSQFLIELSSKSLNINDPNSNPLYTSEILNVLMELKEL